MPGRLRRSRDLVAQDLVWHEPGRHQLGGDYRGREAVYGFFSRLMEVTKGSFRLDLQAAFADDEHRVALDVSTTSRGGRSVAVNDVRISRLRDSKVVEFRDAATDHT
jgi:ketosteroid isomerase-like protein